MSEPIYLYDKHGELHIMHSPKTAHEMVVAGLLFVDPPAQPVVTVLYDAKGNISITKSPAQVEEALSSGEFALERPTHEQVLKELTPDDTQEVPAVPTGKARRKGKGDGGVL